MKNWALFFCQNLLKGLFKRFPRNYKGSKCHEFGMLFDPIWVRNEMPRVRKELPNFVRSISIFRTSCTSHVKDVETSLDELNS